MLAHAKKAKKEQDKKDRRAVNAKTLLQKKMVPEPLTTLQGKHISLDDGCDLASLSQRLLHAGAVVVDSACDAGVVMAANLKPRADPVRWASMLNGCHVIVPSYLEGDRSVVKYNAAVGFWRRVFVTDDFKCKHPVLVQMLETMVAKPISKWVLLPSVAVFNEKLQAARRLKRGGQVSILKRSREQVPGVLPGAKQLGFADFEASIKKVDATRTVTCRRVVGIV